MARSRIFISIEELQAEVKAMLSEEPPIREAKKDAWYYSLLKKGTDHLDIMESKNKAAIAKEFIYYIYWSIPATIIDFEKALKKIRPSKEDTAYRVSLVKAFIFSASFEIMPYRNKWSDYGTPFFIEEHQEDERFNFCGYLRKQIFLENVYITKGNVTQPFLHYALSVFNLNKNGRKRRAFESLLNVSDIEKVIHQRNDQGQTVFDLACIGNNVNAMEALIEKCIKLKTSPIFADEKSLINLLNFESKIRVKYIHNMLFNFNKVINKALELEPFKPLFGSQNKLQEFVNEQKNFTIADRLLQKNMETMLPHKITQPLFHNSHSLFIAIRKQNMCLIHVCLISNIICSQLNTLEQQTKLTAAEIAISLHRYDIAYLLYEKGANIDRLLAMVGKKGAARLSVEAKKLSPKKSIIFLENPNHFHQLMLDILEEKIEADALMSILEACSDLQNRLLAYVSDLVIQDSVDVKKLLYQKQVLEGYARIKVKNSLLFNALSFEVSPFWMDSHLNMNHSNIVKLNQLNKNNGHFLEKNDTILLIRKKMSQCQPLSIEKEINKEVLKVKKPVSMKQQIVDEIKNNIKRCKDDKLIAVYDACLITINDLEAINSIRRKWEPLLRDKDLSTLIKKIEKFENMWVQEAIELSSRPLPC